jgi:hypothetical protein
MNKTTTALALGAAFALAAPVFCEAHAVTRSECVEASQFIMNGAPSRDNGMSRDAYIGQLMGDLETIKAFPAQLRWFVQDDDDAALLLSAAKEVYDAPAPPEHHRQEFLSRCLGRPTTNS